MKPDVRNCRRIAAWKIVPLLVLSVTLRPVSSAALGVAASPFEIKLSGNWFIQSAEKVKADGGTISTAPFFADGWNKASVPSTVLGTLVGNGLYGDVLAEKNLDSVSSAPFAGAWWYRTEFTLPPAPGLPRTRLAFDGVNYRANIWLNGRLLADTDTVKGAFRRFEFDVTDLISARGRNTLAVEVFPPKRGEPTIGFVDWNPWPADANMGLWRGVRVLRSGPVSLHDVYVRTDVDTETLKTARLTVVARAHNETGAGVTGEVSCDIGDIHLSKKLTLAAGENAAVDFNPGDWPQLTLKNPRLWWPRDFGKPELYSMKIRFTAAGKVSDSRSMRFGVRQVSDFLTPGGHRGFSINGRPILIRGAGWTDDIFLRQTAKMVRDQIAYTAHMDLNTIRLEGFWGPDEEIYEACDEAGILIMAGWSCQWEWPDHLGKEVDPDYGGIRSREDMDLIARSWADHVLWLRGHPSLAIWLYGSDKLPFPEQEKAYQAILKNDDPSRPFLAAASWRTSEVTGPTGVKMNGPYDYVPPSYWFEDKTRGGAFGFNTETAPGPQIPVRESLERMLSADHLWPIDDMWLYHTARKDFHNLTRYNEAIDARFGKPENLADYERKAQLLNYDCMRAMYEAFNAAKFTATGVVHWMLNAAWPKLWWQLYDYYLAPTGAFYGARKANAPLHAVFNPADGGVYLVNNGLDGHKGVSVELKVLDTASATRLTQSARLDIPANQSVRVAGLGGITPPEKTYFIDLRVKNAGGKLVDDNFYALSSAPDVLDDAKAEWFVTPVKSHGDLTALSTLPKVALVEKRRYGADPVTGRRYIEVSLENPADRLAFSVELELYKAGKEELVVPVFWDDNFITLLPGEKRVLRAYYDKRDAGDANPALKVRGWNIK
jgi:exo-1,4-beta-D-glucosaminidase